MNFPKRSINPRFRIVQGWTLVRFLSAAWLFCGLLTVHAWAQGNGGGTVTGTVVDSTGAVIPNASIRLVNVATGVSISTHSSEVGEFIYPSVPTGEYSLEITAKGFTSETIKIAVSLNQTTTPKVLLEPGSETTTVTVTSTQLSLDTEDAQATTGIDPDTLQSLPISLNGAARSPTAILNLFPGVSDTSANAGGVLNQTFYASINGGQSYGGEVMYDGAIMTISNVAGDMRQQPIPVDSLQEFTLVQNPFAAQYGNTPGGILSYNTQAGTNTFHGQGYEYLRNDVTNALGYFTRGKTIPLHQNEFGGDFGGPLWLPHLYNGHNKTFFFGWYDGFRFTNTPSSGYSTVPTIAERGGDFSAYVDANGNQIPIYDPATTTPDGHGGYTRTAFPGNIIPADRIVPQAQAFVSVMPKPVNDNIINNVLPSGTNQLVSNRVGIRGDQSIGSKLRLFGLYAWYNNTSNALSSIYQGGWDSGSFGPDPGRLVRVGGTWDISPHLINNFTVGYNHDEAGGVTACMGSGSFAKLGVPGLETNDCGGMFFGDGYASAGQNQNETFIEGGYAIHDAFTWIKGRHTLNFGGEYNIWLDTDKLHGIIPNLNLSDQETGLPDNTTIASGNSFASFLLGYVDNSTVYYRIADPQDKFSALGLYLQDDFKLNQRLTLNLGLRYDLKFTRSSPNSELSSFDPNLPNPGAGNLPGALAFIGHGEGRNGKDRFSNIAYLRFQPRVGFSAQIGRGMVLRGAYAIFNGTSGDVLENGIRNYVDGFNSNPFFAAPNNYTPAFTLTEGFPSFEKPPFIQPTLDNNGNISYLAPQDGYTAITQNWTVDVQKELKGGYLLDVAYVGNNGHHLGGSLNIVNQNNPNVLGLVPNDPQATYNLLNSDINSAAAQTAGISLPYPSFAGNVSHALQPYPMYYSIGQSNQTTGSSRYNALQAKVQRRFSNGFSALVSYTLSKMMSNVDEQQGWYEQYNAGAQNTFDHKAEWSLSGLSVPSTLSISGLYELPFGRGKTFANSGPLALIVGGFSLSGILHYQAGSPLSVTSSQNRLPINSFGQRPTLNSGQSFKAHWSGKFNPWVDIYANSKVAYDSPVDTFGNMPRVAPGFRSFAYYDEDFSLKKEIPLYERLHITLGVDGFNVFNRTQFGSPSLSDPEFSQGSAGSASYGTIGYQGNIPRVLQGNVRMQF